MPRIRFTADPKLPRDLAHLGYVKGTEVDLSEDQAARWLRRGVADVVAPEPVVAVEAQAEMISDVPKIPSVFSADPLPYSQAVVVDGVASVRANPARRR